MERIFLRMGAFDAATPTGPLLQASADDTPRRYFRKRILRTGTFRNGDAVYRIDGAWINRAVANFERMKAAGYDVTVPRTHADWKNPEGNRGYVREMWREGDYLVATFEMIGRDAIEAAQRSDVSIGAHARWESPTGEAYEWPIIHVALATTPVVPGLGKFEPQAIAAELTFQTSSENDSMDEILKALAELLGIDAEKAGPDLGKAIVAAVALLKEKSAGGNPPASGDNSDGGGKLNAPANPPPGANMSRDEQTAKLIFDQVAPLKRDNRKLKLDSLLAAGKIDANAHRKLVEAHTSDTALRFSIEHGDSNFDLLCSVLADNAPAPLGAAQPLPNNANRLNGVAAAVEQITGANSK